MASTIVSVCLLGEVRLDVNGRYAPTTTIDDTVVVSIMKLLPKLRYLALHSFHYVMPPDASAVCTPAGPFPLASFTIRTHSQGRSSLKGGLRVLSLFDPVAWSSLDFDRFDVDESFEPQWLHRPLDLRRLNLSRSSGSSPKHTASVMQALSMSLKSDSLQELYVQVDSKDTVVALGKLLSYAGRNITTLAIQNDGSYTSTRDGWVDPLEGETKIRPWLENTP